MWRKVILEKDTSTWEDIISSLPQKKNTEKEDSDWNEDTHMPAESQFEDATVTVKMCMDTMEGSTAELPPLENIVEASVSPGNQDMVQIHMGEWWPWLGISTYASPPDKHLKQQTFEAGSVRKQVHTRKWWL